MERRRFRNRSEAGQALAERLQEYTSRDDVLVLGLPRGGVPVAYEVAKRLGAPLGVFVVRKLGVPGHEELAMGAIASGGILVLDQHLVRRVGIGDGELERVIAAELRELSRREVAFGGGRGPRDLEQKIVVLVDDGLATGSTMRAAALAVGKRNPAKVVVAVPVAAAETCNDVRDIVDDVVCDVTPRHFGAVGFWYEDFSETTDEEVRELLEHAAQSTRAPS